MSKHTPGPWVTGNRDWLLFGAKQDDGIKPIGFVYGPSFPERSEIGQRALANARLIAAAPDLLDALQRVMRHIPDNAGGASLSDDMHRAKKALAKATGG